MNGLLRHKTSSHAKTESNPLTRLHEEIDHAMQDFYNLFESAGSRLGVFENLRLSPSIDLVEDKESFKIECEMPGMGEEDIKISINENTITIEGEKTISKKDEKKNFLSREISYGRYERSLSLPPTANLDKAKASFKKGMLWITIPKKTLGKNSVRKINIEKAK